MDVSAQLLVSGDLFRLGEGGGLSQFHHAKTGGWGPYQVSGLCSVVPEDLESLVGEKWGAKK